MLTSVWRVISIPRKQALYRSKKRTNVVLCQGYFLIIRNSTSIPPGTFLWSTLPGCKCLPKCPIYIENSNSLSSLNFNLQYLCLPLFNRTYVKLVQIPILTSIKYLLTIVHQLTGKLCATNPGNYRYASFQSYTSHFQRKTPISVISHFSRGILHPLLELPVRPVLTCKPLAKLIVTFFRKHLLAITNSSIPGECLFLN